MYTTQKCWSDAGCIKGHHRLDSTTVILAGLLAVLTVLQAIPDTTHELTIQLPTQSMVNSLLDTSPLGVKHVIMSDYDYICSAKKQLVFLKDRHDIKSPFASGFLADYLGDVLTSKESEILLQGKLQMDLDKIPLPETKKILQFIATAYQQPMQPCSGIITLQHSFPIIKLSKRKRHPRILGAMLDTTKRYLITHTYSTLTP